MREASDRKADSVGPGTKRKGTKEWRHRDMATVGTGE